MNNTAAGWVSGAYFGGYVLVVPFLTAMTDRVDARYVFVLGALLSAGGLVGLAFLATGFWSALPWRVIAGAGLAGCYMPGLKVLTDRLPPARHARAVAFYTACFSVGTAASYALAGGALEWFGWRGAFLFVAAGPLLSIVVLMTLAAPRAPEAAVEERRHVLDFRPVLRSRETMGYIVAYAGHGAELFAMRSWIVPFLVFCLGSGGAFELNATLFATTTALVAVFASIGGAELALRVGRARLIAMGDAGDVRAQCGDWLLFAIALRRGRIPLPGLCRCHPGRFCRADRRRRRVIAGWSPWRDAGGAFDTRVRRVAVRAGAGGRGARRRRAARRADRLGARVPRDGIGGPAGLRLLHAAAPTAASRALFAIDASNGGFGWRRPFDPSHRHITIVAHDDVAGDEFGRIAGKEHGGPYQLLRETAPLPNHSIHDEVGGDGGP